MQYSNRAVSQEQLNKSVWLCERVSSWDEFVLLVNNWGIFLQNAKTLIYQLYTGGSFASCATERLSVNPTSSSLVWWAGGEKKHNENIISNSSLPLLDYATWQNKIRQVQSAGPPLMCCKRRTPQSSVMANPFTSVLQLSFTLTDWNGQHTSSPSEAQNKSTPSLPN